MADVPDLAAADGDPAAGDAGPESPAGPPRRGRLRRVATWTGLSVLGLFLVIQLVPYGWRHPNPPVVRDAPWPDAESAAIARRACYDCHSNESKWPAYSYVAPLSWLVRYDVDQARERFNFSDWDRYQGKASNAVDQVLAGTMPQTRYTIIHRSAKLTDAEVSKLSDALGQMSQDPSGGDGDGDGEGVAGGG